MKTLQSYFTTPEQSKRLLELGVPADSADCYYLSLGKNTSKFNHPCYCYKPYSVLSEVDYYAIYTLYPCWTVGQLIKICLKCSTLEHRQVRFFCNGDDDYYDFMAYTINILESGVITNHMDFSKLEE